MPWIYKLNEIQSWGENGLNSSLNWFEMNYRETLSKWLLPSKNIKFTKQNNFSFAVHQQIVPSDS